MREIMSTHKRLTFLVLFLGVTTMLFWSGSRYPSLDEKAIMGGQAALEDPITFEATLQAQPSDGVRIRIFYSTVNWIETNLEGMAFGLVVGACLLTIMSSLPVRGHSNGFLNTLLGVGIGTPLGVCVNCAAPVAKGMHDAGARLETTLATMFSSPTLNIVIISMLFSIFPLYIIVIKLAFTVGFIAFLLPLLCRWVFSHERLATYQDSQCPIPSASKGPTDESWFAALQSVVVDLVRSLIYIGVRTIPLMLLAGLLGAIVANVMPLTEMVATETTLLSLLTVAVIGIFLPVPVAFDIVVVAVLITAGAPMAYSMTLLFTLGIFSIYPFGIIWTSISRRVAITLTIVLVILGMAAGLIAQEFHRAELDEMFEYLEQQAQ